MRYYTYIIMQWKNIDSINDYKKKKDLVWNKAEIIKGQDPRRVRMDSAGNKIKYADYGNKFSPTGWDIDHIIPQDKGGNSSLFNLQALDSKTNQNWRADINRSNANKPGVTELHIKMLLRESNNKKLEDAHYDKQKLVNTRMSKSDKEYIKACNDGTCELVLNTKRARKYLFPPKELHKLVFEEEE